MQREEMRDAGRLAGSALGDVTVLVRDVHRAVATRVFGLLGPRGATVKLLHDGVADFSYAAVGAGVRTLAPAAGYVTSVVRDEHVMTPRGRVVLAAVNGIYGDRMAVDQPSLALPMTLRTHTGPRRLSAGELAADVDPTGSLVIFVPGLCESDDAWWRDAQQHWDDPDTTYGSLLAAESGWTPLYLSYNSGVRISVNGAQLAALLEDVVLHWPVPVERIALVGHSMGGLVARSAGHVGQQAGHRWSALLSHVVCLSTPHLGAPLERLVNAGTHRLAQLPETRPIATWLNRRSVGIKDLRYGSLVEADWLDADPDEYLRDRCTPVPFLAHVRYHYVAATLTRRADHPLGAVLGDLLVQFPSASGAGPVRRIPFGDGDGRHLGGLHHLDLLNHPAVYEQLLDWLG